MEPLCLSDTLYACLFALLFSRSRACRRIRRWVLSLPSAPQSRKGGGCRIRRNGGGGAVRKRSQYLVPQFDGIQPRGDPYAGKDTWLFAQLSVDELGVVCRIKLSGEACRVLVAPQCRARADASGRPAGGRGR